MAIYYFTIFFPILLLFIDNKLNFFFKNFIYILYGCFLTIYIGFRHEIGGDWDTYNTLFNRIANLNFLELLNMRYEFGYILLNWLISKIDLGIYYVNFIIAIIFVSGLMIFCYNQPYKWLGVLISTPYLINVVAMGATKQSASIGFVLIAYVLWQKQKSIYLILALIFFAFLFHKSAILLTLLTLPLIKKNNLVLIMSLGIFISFFQFYSLFVEYKAYFFNHIRQAVAKGALIKISMNLLCSAIYMIFIFNNQKFKSDKYLYLMISITIFLLFVSIPFASAAAERFSLYFIPIQIVALTRSLYLIKDSFLKSIFLNSIVLGYFCVFIVWFYFSYHTYMHVPYKFIAIF
jgi:hypothetical protein